MVQRTLAFPRWFHNAALLWLACVLLFTPQPAGADGDRDATSYALTAWTTDAGPDDVNVIAQDAEGFLWLGTSSGLVRFDGVEFSVWGTRGEPMLPGKVVQAVVATHDGGLWLGYGDVPGVSLIRNGSVVNYGPRDGLPAGPLGAMVQDRQGIVWAGGLNGLLRFVGDRWQTLGPEQGFPGTGVRSLFEDERRRLWVGTVTGIYRREGDTFELVDSRVNNNHIVEDGTGAIWVTDTFQIVRKLGDGSRPQLAPDIRVPTAGWRLARDGRGSLWVSAVDSGLLHLRFVDGQPPVLERFNYDHKISGSPRPIFRDRDNNIWVGMRGGGLLRIGESAVENNVALDGLTNDGVHSLAVSHDGSVWVATGRSINRFLNGRRTVYPVAQSLALDTDTSGGVWVATTQGISRFVDGRFEPLPLPDVMRWSRVGSIATDATGGLWICNLDRGLFRWQHGVISRIEDPGIGQRPCNTVYADRVGRMWIGFPSGGVAVHDAGRFRNFGDADRVPPGATLAFYEDTKGAVWVSTASGVSRFQNDRWTTVTIRNLPLTKPVPSMFEDSDGYMWVGVNSGSGMLRFDPSEVDKIALNAGHQIEYRLLDVADGLLGDLRLAGKPSGVRGTDGRLWFSTGTGVAIIEPQRLPRAQRLRPPRIVGIVANGRTLAPTQDFEAPSQTLVLAVEYSALSLVGGSKLRFRYMLEGIDEDWVDAGLRRQASYADIPPGRYRFLVSVTNDGLWTEPALWSFSVPAPFYRTRTFLVLVSMGMALLVTVVWWMRLRTVRHQFALVLAERERLSREIHDTLLQSLSAINIELEATASRLGSSHDASDTLRRLRRHVVRSVREARDWIWELRSGHGSARELADALEQVAENATFGTPVAVDVSVTGRARACVAEVEFQFLRICQEAVNNAMRHGGATRLQIALDYGRESLTLRVTDNGCGFLPNERYKEADGHWGIKFMKERAARIGGRLDISSSPGQGTVIQVTAAVMSAG